MRIVMLCDDVQIDRRILAESETLTAEGYEVILLARAGDGHPTFEWIGNVKVERIEPQSICLQDEILLKLTAGAARALRKLADGFLAVVAALVNLLLLPLKAIARALQWLASGFERAGQLGVRVLRRLRQALPHENQILRRVIDYNPDCIHAHDLPQLPIAVAAKKALQIPLVYDAHELYPEIHTLTAKQKRRLQQRERCCIREADAVITVNPFIANEMARRYRVDPPAVLLNSLNPACGFDPCDDHDRFRKVLPIPQRSVILLYQGWLALFRGLKPLVESMPKVDEHAHLVFMGYGTDREALQALARSHNVGHRVHFLDAVPQDELLAWTASADVGIIPYQQSDLNNFYCSPNKLFEYIQAGLPIVANDLPFLRRTVHENGFGVVANLHSAESFSEALNAMCRQPDFREACRTNLLRRRGEFSWNAQAPVLAEIYRNVVREEATVSGSPEKQSRGRTNGRFSRKLPELVRM